MEKGDRNKAELQLKKNFKCIKQHTAVKSITGGLSGHSRYYFGLCRNNCVHLTDLVGSHRGADYTKPDTLACVPPKSLCTA